MNTQYIENTLDQLNEIISLDYLDFIKDNPKTISFNGEKFNLFTIDELCKPVVIHGMEILTIHSLKAHVPNLQKVNSNFTYDQNGIAFSLHRFSLSVLIGYANENLIFIDYRDKNRIYIFHPKSRDITKTALTVNKIIKNEY
ncbi:hypothetical protein [Flavobacterium sp.]|uniref:hypothetical protein n=1 Tax=Flavobacterium sp. TaxID=239 RepID=UPI004048E02A